jgi:hypothetical protein
MKYGNNEVAAHYAGSRAPALAESSKDDGPSAAWAGSPRLPHNVALVNKDKDIPHEAFAHHAARWQPATRD